jgi:hypothetical protein
MANWYSDFYGTGVAQSAIDVDEKAPVSTDSARVYKSRVILDLTTAALVQGFPGERAILHTFRSSDRISSILARWSGIGDVFLDMGVSETGANNDGPVIDADLFFTDLIVGDQATYTEVYDYGTIDATHSGKPLWVQSGAYAEDPGINFDVVVGFSHAGPDEAGGILDLIFEFWR